MSAEEELNSYLLVERKFLRPPLSDKLSSMAAFLTFQRSVTEILKSTMDDSDKLSALQVLTESVVGDVGGRDEVPPSVDAIAPNTIGETNTSVTPEQKPHAGRQDVGDSPIQEAEEEVSRPYDRITSWTLLET